MTMPDRIWAWPKDSEKPTSGLWRAEAHGFHASDMDGGTEYAPVCQHPNESDPTDLPDDLARRVSEVGLAKVFWLGFLIGAPVGSILLCMALAVLR